MILFHPVSLCPSLSKKIRSAAPARWRLLSSLDVGVVVGGDVRLQQHHLLKAQNFRWSLKVLCSELLAGNTHQSAGGRAAPVCRGRRRAAFGDAWVLMRDELRRLVSGAGLTPGRAADPCPTTTRLIMASSRAKPARPLPTE